MQTFHDFIWMREKIKIRWRNRVLGICFIIFFFFFWANIFLNKIYCLTTFDQNIFWALKIIFYHGFFIRTSLPHNCLLSSLLREPKTCYIFKKKVCTLNLMVTIFESFCVQKLEQMHWNRTTNFGSASNLQDCDCKQL